LSDVMQSSVFIERFGPASDLNNNDT